MNNLNKWKTLLKKYNLLEMLSSIAAVALFYRILGAFGITCPILYLTGISCGGCGMTRAWIAVLHGNIRLAFYYHPLFWLVPITIMILFFKRKIHPIIYNFFIFTIILLFVIIYLYRLLDSNDNIVVADPRNGVIFRVLNLLTK